MAPYPDRVLRQHISHNSWDTCLNAWILLCRTQLLLEPERFSDNLGPKSPLTTFITTYVSAAATDKGVVVEYGKPRDLHEVVFLLIHRAFTEARDVPKVLLHWTFLADFARLYGHSEATAKILQNMWTKHSSSCEKRLQDVRSSLVAASSIAEDPIWHSIPRLAHLVRLLPPVGELLMTGTDLLDSLVTAHSNVASTISSSILALVYLSLVSLLRLQKPNISLLKEQLYSLQSSAHDAKSSKINQEPFIVSLISETPLLLKIRRELPESQMGRIQSVLVSLERLSRPTTHKLKKRVNHKIDRGKDRTADDFRHGALSGEIHPHRMSLIVGVQDVFPDLGSAFILRLLDEYGDNQETVIAALLEDNVPPHFSSLDRSEKLLPTASVTQDRATADVLIPPSPSSPRLTSELTTERRNVFDNDAFDRLNISPSQIHHGRRTNSKTADGLLADRTRDQSSHNAQKAAIYSALATFDPDDDERDDTYDAEDVGGTVDGSRPGDEHAEISDLHNLNEESLFRTWQSAPQVFERGSANRLSQARRALKSETGMTDEAIEGWALMLQREPGRLRVLEGKHAAFTSQQRQLASTKWSAGDDDDSGHESGRGRGGLRGRGRTRGRGGKGNTAGPSGEKSTQIARDRKEANKGMTANHNRRDQRVKKMARGGLPG